MRSSNKVVHSPKTITKQKGRFFSTARHEVSSPLKNSHTTSDIFCDLDKENLRSEQTIQRAQTMLPTTPSKSTPKRLFGKKQPKSPKTPERAVPERPKVPIKPSAYGQPLWKLMEGQKQTHPDSKIPYVVERLIAIIEKHHMEAEGLFRQCGSLTEINAFKAKIYADFSDFPEKELEESDPHVLAGLLKTFFRDLPLSLIRKEVYDLFLEITNDPLDTNKEDMYTMLSHAFNDLAEFEYQTLRAICLFLHAVSLKSPFNAMTASNLSTCWCPNLFPSVDINLALQSHNYINFSQNENDCLKKLIIEAPYIFPAPEAEREASKDPTESSECATTFSCSFFEDKKTEPVVETESGAEASPDNNEAQEPIAPPTSQSVPTPESIPDLARGCSSESLGMTMNRAYSSESLGDSLNTQNLAEVLKLSFPLSEEKKTPNTLSPFALSPRKRPVSYKPLPKRPESAVPELPAQGNPTICIGEATERTENDSVSQISSSDCDFVLHVACDYSTTISVFQPEPEAPELPPRLNHSLSSAAVVPTVNINDLMKESEPVISDETEEQVLEQRAASEPVMNMAAHKRLNSTFSLDTICNGVANSESEFSYEGPIHQIEEYIKQISSVVSSFETESAEASIGVDSKEASCETVTTESASTSSRNLVVDTPKKSKKTKRGTTSKTNTPSKRIRTSDVKKVEVQTENGSFLVSSTAAKAIEEGQLLREAILSSLHPTPVKTRPIEELSEARPSEMRTPEKLLNSPSIKRTPARRFAMTTEDVPQTPQTPEVKELKFKGIPSGSPCPSPSKRITDSPGSKFRSLGKSFGRKKQNPSINTRLFFGDTTTQDANSWVDLLKSDGTPTIPATITSTPSRKRARPLSMVITPSEAHDFKRMKKQTFKKCLSVGDESFFTEASSMYYYNDSDKVNSKVVHFLKDNHVTPANFVDDMATPMTVEEAYQFALHFRNIVVAAKDGSGKVIYTGSPSYLDEIQLKQFLSTEQTFHLRTPSMALFDQSLLLIGWSKEAWERYAVLRVPISTPTSK
eukprot:TRINITY_DN2312_c0_g1_i1.p1 TRINITY_DN2312_c0_g1~~TRINITY_DN2312_c0_g1_i1.p1  ORF type:complete len:1029 (+),score=267.55 TRINITY_DN2312_c0_g1_i1:20-3106(+)